jgi:hypothetical protein
MDGNTNRNSVCEAMDRPGVHIQNIRFGTGGRCVPWSARTAHNGGSGVRVPAQSVNRGERLWRVGQRRADFPGRITDARGSGCWHAPCMGMLPKLSESARAHRLHRQHRLGAGKPPRAHRADCASRGVRTKTGIVLVVFFWYSV